jgi:hypothetical protein
VLPRKQGYVELQEELLGANIIYHEQPLRQNMEQELHLHKLFLPLHQDSLIHLLQYFVTSLCKVNPLILNRLIWPKK